MSGCEGNLGRGKTGKDRVYRKKTEFELPKPGMGKPDNQMDLNNSTQDERNFYDYNLDDYNGNDALERLKNRTKKRGKEGKLARFKL